MSKIDELKSLLDLVREIGYSSPLATDEVNRLLAESQVEVAVQNAEASGSSDDSRKAIDLIDEQIKKSRILSAELERIKKLRSATESRSQYTWNDNVYDRSSETAGRLQAAQSVPVVRQVSQQLPPIPGLGKFTAGETPEGIKERAEEIAELYYAEYREQVIAHFSKLAQHLGIDFTETALGTASGQMSYGQGKDGSDLLELDIKNMVKTYIDRSLEQGQRGLITWDDKSTGLRRDYSVFSDFAGYVKTVFAHEVAHSEQGYKENKPMSSAQVEALVRAQEPRVMRLLYGDTQGNQYDKDLALYPTEAPPTMRERVMTKFTRMFDAIGLKKRPSHSQGSLVDSSAANDPAVIDALWIRERKRQRELQQEEAAKTKSAPSYRSAADPGTSWSPRGARRTTTQAVPITPLELTKILDEVSFVQFDPNVASPEEINLRVRQNEILTKAAERWAKNVLANPSKKSEKELTAAKSISEQVKAYQSLVDSGVDKSSTESQSAMDSIVSVFKDAAPTNYNNLANAQSTPEQRSELRNLFTSISTIFESLGMDDPMVRAAATAGSTQSEIMAGLTRIFRYIGINDPTRQNQTVLAGRLISSSPTLLRQIAQLPAENIRRLFKSAIRNPEKPEDVLPPTEATSVGSGVVSNVFEDVYDEPGEDNRQYSTATEFYNRRGLGVRRFINSIKTAVVEGSQVAGGQASVVFGEGPGFNIERDLTELYKIVMGEIEEGDLVEIETASGEKKSVPRSLGESGMITRIRQAVANSSQYTTLMGSLRQDGRGLQSALEQNGQQLFVDLGAAMLLESVLKSTKDGTPIENPVDRMRASITDPEEKFLDGELVSKPPTTNMIDLQFSLLREGMEFYANQAQEAYITEENPELVALRKKE
jgi:hypothetical protein